MNKRQLYQQIKFAISGDAQTLKRDIAAIRSAVIPYLNDLDPVLPPLLWNFRHAATLGTDEQFLTAIHLLRASGLGEWSISDDNYQTSLYLSNAFKQG